MKHYDIISELEIKMIDFKHTKRKTRNDPPMLALTKEERDIYADFLESTGRIQGSLAFRNYTEPPITPKDIKKRSKQAQTLKKDALSTYERLLLNAKESCASIVGWKNQLDGVDQNELKILLKFIEAYQVKGNNKPATLQRSYREQTIELIKEKMKK